jgi:hypothetical protein
MPAGHHARAHQAGGINVLTVFSAAEPTKGARYLFAPEALRGRYADWNLRTSRKAAPPCTDHDDDDPSPRPVMLVASAHDEFSLSRRIAVYTLVAR